MNKLYKRDGRRFVQIEDHLGMFYQKDGTFTKEKTERSIGLCIISDFKKDVVMELEDRRCTYDETDTNNIPYQIEFLAASKFNKILKLLLYRDYFCMVRAFFNTYCGWFYFNSHYGSSHNGADIGNRRLLYRKVHRIKK